MVFGTQALNRMIPNADVLAADARVREHGVCNDGAILLMKAMWGQLHHDLTSHHAEARDWLDTPECERWATLCGGKPETVRERLMDTYWWVCS
ncbi:MAG: hypothetical protein LC793_22030 [Thermomicrobia bacterium]|nr:hypothetical protein [Thermomicrobia bacterium]